MKTTTEPVLRMHNPPHPGTVLREGWVTPLGLSVTGLAQRLGVSRKTLSAILNGRVSITVAMAVRLAKVFDTTPESWLAQQMQWDLWQVQHPRRPRPSRPARKRAA